LKVFAGMFVMVAVLDKAFENSMIKMVSDAT